MSSRDGRLRLASTVLAGAVVVAALGGCTGGSGTGKDAVSTPAPGSALKIVLASDSEDAVAGRDYDVVATLRGHRAEQAVGLAPDGAVVLVGYAAGDDAHSHPVFSLLEPGTGERTPVIAAPGRATLDAVTADSVVTSSVVDGRLVVVSFDRASGSVTRRTVPRAPAPPGARPLADSVLIADGAVWFLTFMSRGESGGNTHTQLWRAPASGRPRLVARVTDFAVAADAVVWTDPAGHASGTIHVRDLADGSGSTFSLPECTAGSTSAALESVRAAGSLVALQTTCPHAPYDRTFVARTDGTFLADLVINQEAQPTCSATGW